MKRIDKLLLARKQVATWESKREEAIRTLVKAEDKLPQLRKVVKRLVDRALTVETKTAPPAPRMTHAVTVEKSDKNLPADDGLEIPSYLQRKAEGAAKDKAAADAIRQELAAQQEAKRRKSNEKAKIKKEVRQADLTGKTRRMPLSGKAAIQAIKDETLSLGHLGPLP